MWLKEAVLLKEFGKWEGWDGTEENLLRILFIDLWWGFSLYGFASLFVFLLCSYFFIICYNVHLDRHCACHSGVLWQHTLRWRSGSKVFIRDQLLWKEVDRKKDWAEAKFTLWCRHSKVLASPAESSVTSIACSGLNGWFFLSPPCSLQDGQPCGRGQQLRLVLPIPQTWQQAPCWGGTEQHILPLTSLSCNFLHI